MPRPPKSSNNIASLFFLVKDRNVCEIPKQIESFRSEYRLMNTVMASFDTTARQITEMAQSPKCLRKD